MTTREDALALDRDEPLAPFRDRFVIDDDNRIYADGNSLGRLPKETVARLSQRVDEWGERLVSAWPDWIDLPVRAGDLLARDVLGARAGEVIVSDSTTVNLYKLARAAIAARPGAIVTDTANFPTDRYVLAGVGELLQFESDEIYGPSADDVERACTGGDVSLVCLSHVAYRSGALADVAAITAAAHAAGTLVLWDLSHSAGAVAVELEADDVDLAVGCTYKYLNAGPGAPAFLYVRESLQGELRSPIQGWFGQRNQFEMGAAYDPEPGIAKFLAGTPPILDLTAVEAGVELVAEAGIDALREKSVRLTELVIELHDAWLEPLGFALGSPRDAARRGAHVALSHDDAWQICRALIERADVVPDFRRPNVVRLGLPPLYTRFVDAWDMVDRLRRLVESGEYREVDAGTARVT